jgi:hypothetical protein
VGRKAKDMNTAIVDTLIKARAQDDPELAQILKEFLEEITKLSVETLDNNEFIYAKDTTGKQDVRILGLDKENHIVLGDRDRAKQTGEFHLIIPSVQLEQLPSINPRLDGLLVIDNVTQVLCFYIGTNRYRIAGAAF